MAGDNESDPFLWDEDRVVLELCSPNKSWDAPPARRLPEPAALEARLRDCGVDGETLLRYGDELDLDKLWAYLGVNKLSHQLSLNAAISQFKKRSKRYQEWRAQQLADSQLCAEEVAGMRFHVEPQTSANSPHGIRATPTPALAGVAGTDSEEAPQEPADVCGGVMSPAPSATISQDPVVAAGTPEVPGTSEEPPEEPPAKKRRIAPTAVSTKPTHNSAFAFIPTEGDILMRGTMESILRAGDASGFLGADALLRDQLTDLSAVDPATDEEKGFALVRRQIPPGRRIQVNAAMKRLLRSDGAERTKPGADAAGDRNDPLLPLFGESDDESVDTTTWREIQEEESERQAKEAREAVAKDKVLSKEEVRDIVSHAIRELEAQWEADKKPKHELHAWKMWQAARSNPEHLADIESARNKLNHYKSLVAKYSKDIINLSWTVGDDLPRKVLYWLERSVFGSKYQAWYIDIIQSPRQPPKPSTLPRPKPRRAKPVELDDDSENLTSDSDDMGAFVEDDEEEEVAIPFVDDEMDVDPELPEAESTVAESPAHDSPGSPDGEDTAAEDDGVALPSARATPTKIKVEGVPPPATPRPAGRSALEPIEISSSPAPCEQQENDAPGFDDIESLRAIGELGVEHWEQAKDAERLVVAVLWAWPREKVDILHHNTKTHNHQQLWGEHISPAIQDYSAIRADSSSFIVCRLFDVFYSKTAKRANAQSLRSSTCQRMRREGHLFEAFCAHIKKVVPLLVASFQAPARIVAETPRKELSASQRSRADEEAMDDSSNPEDSSPDDVAAPSTKKRRRRKRRDRTAADLRANMANFNEELARRSRQLRQQIATQGSVSSKLSRLIVNETKESDDQALIYINDHIGSKIKDHQIEGVRFMWNQVVVRSKVRQGCLLAHTMGLGKTMQVITLLVVIAEASASPDPSVRSQIPRNLRNSKTLILCPPSLVDNWLDEIRMWAPNGVLGLVHRLDMPSSYRRTETIKSWASAGGVLVVGYTMFTNLVRGDENTARLLLETPSLVVGDEAHYMKNPESQRHQATANFTTMNRIAMTGSPLTNNVMDYYAMINWVAPNFLADIAEFRERFSNPIKEGLYVDSEPHQKKRARRMLHVLKATVEPKVHRRDIEVLLNELPKKKEFIITLPLTKVQEQLYRSYIDWAANPGRELASRSGQARAWSLVAKLGLVLAHPIIFKTNAEAQKAKPPGSTPQSSRPPKIIGNDESDEDKVELPQDVLIGLLATVAVREIEDYSLSNKIILLLRILDECKRVGDKVLVFSQSIASMDYIENIFKRRKVVYQRLDGQTPMGTRQDSVKSFNRDSDSQVYLISTRAGGVGLNIHGANRVVIFDFRYTPAEEQQAIGRAYRLGQTKPVYVYWLTIGGTFEDTIHNNAVFKTQLASRVVDKKNPDPWSTRFSEYFAMPREVEQEDLSSAHGQDKVLDALLESEEVGKLIRKITSTETFEREEKYELTPEERQEAEKDIEMERLRSQNPEEYRRREHERAFQMRAALGMPSMPPPSFYQARPIDALANATFPPAHHTTNMATNTAATAAMAAATAPPPTSSPAPALPPPPPSAVQPRPDQDSGAVGQPAPSPSQKEANGSPADAAGPQPILASGSAFKITPTLPASLLNSPSTANAGAGEDNGSEVSEELLTVHRTLCQEGRHVRHHPVDLMHRVNGVLVRDKIEKLPKLDKLQNLKKFSRDPRFAEAMLSGYMEPEQLASLSRLEMERIAASLNGMAEPEFKQRVWTTKADLNHLRKPPARIKTERVSTRGSSDARDRGNLHRGVLRFIGSGSESQDADAPQEGRRAAVRRGDSADMPHIID